MKIQAVLPEERELVDFSELKIGMWFRMDLNGEMLRSTWKKVDRISGFDGENVLEQGYFKKVWWIKNYIDLNTIEIHGSA